MDWELSGAEGVYIRLWADAVLSIILSVATPSILTGVRISLGISWVFEVVTEMIAARSSGIGFFILDMQRDT